MLKCREIGRWERRSEPFHASPRAQNASLISALIYGTSHTWGRSTKKKTVSSWLPSEENSWHQATFRARTYIPRLSRSSYNLLDDRPTHRRVVVSRSVESYIFKFSPASLSLFLFVFRGATGSSAFRATLNPSSKCISANRSASISRRFPRVIGCKIGSCKCLIHILGVSAENRRMFFCYRFFCRFAVDSFFAKKSDHHLIFYSFVTNRNISNKIEILCITPK